MDFSFINQLLRELDFCLAFARVAAPCILCPTKPNAGLAVDPLPTALASQTWLRRRFAYRSGLAPRKTGVLRGGKYDLLKSGASL
jgi:hypothetical protein